MRCDWLDNVDCSRMETPKSSDDEEEEAMETTKKSKKSKNKLLDTTTMSSMVEEDLDAESADNKIGILINFFLVLCCVYQQNAFFN